MSKKLQMTIAIALFAALLAGTFLYVQKAQKVSDEIAKSDETINQNAIVYAVVGSQEKNDFVWYEIPELNIKFKVTPDTKEDLAYITHDDNSSAYLYSLSSKSFLDQNSARKLNLISYSELSIGVVNESENERVFKERGRYACEPENVIKKINSSIFCLNHAQSPVFDSRKQHDEYLKTITNKRFDINFDSLEQLHTD